MHVSHHRPRAARRLIDDLDFSAIREEIGVPGPFPESVLAEAADNLTVPGPARDATDVPFVTIDPPGATDLDQAVFIERRGDGWQVHYAIADVGSWVGPGSLVDAEARLRTQTFYSPDLRVPLHPPVLGEQAASLLPDGPRPAVIWSIGVDGDGATESVQVERATIRSRAQLTYQQVQDDIDAGNPPEPIAELPALGAALLADARRRDAIDLGLPEQQVEVDPDGRWTVTLRADLPVEHWNAQISLLTGRAAAGLMVEAGFGILRTLPAADRDVVPRLRAAAASLGIPWPDRTHPGALLADLDTSRPRHAALAELAAELLRGAAYTAFDGALPDDPGHAGIGGPYAHVTAPLRRLVDRFGLEISLMVHDGRTIPDWLRGALVDLPGDMARGDSLHRQLDRAVVDATEAYVLAHRVGETFEAAVVETGDDWGTVALDEPAARGRCDTPQLPLGEVIHVRCTVADVAERMVRFERTS